MKNGGNTDGKFSAGNSGRPKGARNKKTVTIGSLSEGQVKALTYTAMSKALSGDSMVQRRSMKHIGTAPRIFLYHSPFSR